MASPPAPPLVLASTSPRRRQILEQLRIPFDVVPPRYDETEEDPVAHALGKARSVLVEAEGRPVLGCDTEVVCDGRVYGQPAGPDPQAVEVGWAAGASHEALKDDSLYAAKSQLNEAVEELLGVIRDPRLLESIGSIDRANLAKYLTIAKLRLENAIAVIGRVRRQMGIAQP